MRKLKIGFVILLVLAVPSARAQKSELILNYIETYREIAIEEMKRTGVPASIKLAQGIFETTAGTSPLVMRSSNHFGIKCKSNWTGESVKHDDDLKGECFRKYPSAFDSYRDHSNFLKDNSRYAALFTLDPMDYRGWATGLKKAGYATSTKYSQALIKLIEDYNLQAYTYLALGKTEEESGIKTAVNSENPANEAIQVNEPAVVNTAIKENSYPTEAFRINGIKVVFMKKNTSYLQIARKYDVDLAKIFEYNEIPRTEQTNSDQLIFLQRKAKTGQNEFHIVQPGETLHSIAQTEAIRLESLKELNALKGDDNPAPGEKLSLQKKSGSMPRLAVNKNSLSPSGNKQASN